MGRELQLEPTFAKRPLRAKGPPCLDAQHGRPALQDLLEPEVGELLLHRVRAQSFAQVAEVDGVEILILIEARENYAFLTGDGVAKLLEALSTNLLHHALHRRVDAPDGKMPGVEHRREHAVARLPDRVHHSLAA